MDFGYHGVYLVDGGVDLFNDKVIRASSGSIFHLPFAKGSWDEAPLDNRPLFSADMKGIPFGSVKPPTRFGLVLGSEGQGLTNFIKSKSTEISVDQISGIDSLNVSVAGGILLHHFRRP